MAGSGNTTDTRAGRYFRQLVTTREPVQYVVVSHGKHTPPAWRVALAGLLQWTWHTISGGDGRNWHHATRRPRRTVNRPEHVNVTASIRKELTPIDSRKRLMTPHTGDLSDLPALCRSNDSSL